MTMPPGARNPLDDLLGEPDERSVLIEKIAHLEDSLDKAGILSDWINRARPVIQELMLAYERRIRSDCRTQDELENKPWRCMEYIAAENLLNDQPIAIVELGFAVSANTGNGNE